MYLKIFLFKYNRMDDRLEVIEVPRWMTKHERECYQRELKTVYSDYILCVGYDAIEVAERVLGGFVSDER